MPTIHSFIKLYSLGNSIVIWSAFCTFWLWSHFVEMHIYHWHRIWIFDTHISLIKILYMHLNILIIMISVVILSNKRSNWKCLLPKRKVWRTCYDRKNAEMSKLWHFHSPAVFACRISMDGSQHSTILWWIVQFCNGQYYFSILSVCCMKVHSGPGLYFPGNRFQLKRTLQSHFAQVFLKNICVAICSEI